VGPTSVGLALCRRAGVMVDALVRVNKQDAGEDDADGALGLIVGQRAQEGVDWHAHIARWPKGAITSRRRSLLLCRNDDKSVAARWEKPH